MLGFHSCDVVGDTHSRTHPVPRARESERDGDTIEKQTTSTYAMHVGNERVEAGRQAGGEGNPFVPVVGVASCRVSVIVVFVFDWLTVRPDRGRERDTRYRCVVAVE